MSTSSSSRYLSRSSTVAVSSIRALLAFSNAVGEKGTGGVRRLQRCHFVLALEVALAACGGAASERAAECQPASEYVAGITEGLIGGATSLSNAVAVPLGSPFEGIRVVIAARIAGLGNTEVGAWAVGDNGGGPIYALDASARRYSSWGSAAREGSPADQLRKTLAARPEVAAAKACASRSE